MDLATLIGLIGAFGVIIGAIATGGDTGLFVNAPSMMIVIGGTFMATLIKIPLSDFFRSFKVGMKAFLHKPDNPVKLIEEAVVLSDVARKNGLLALEGQEISNSFLQRGVSLCVDGHDAGLVNRMLTKDINQTIARHETGVRMFKSIGDVAPAMGMIGTLVGLVQMLANMSDPAAIGPSMAVALLTTLYGAIIANAFALPIADKLSHISNEERINRSLILETIAGIQEGMNPRVLEELLKTFLPEGKRNQEIGDDDDGGAEEDAA